METTAHVTISTDQKIRNLIVSVSELERSLRQEGRYVSAGVLYIVEQELGVALKNHGSQTPGHD